MRLVDCFLELFAYIGGLLRQTERPDYATVRDMVEGLLRQCESCAERAGFTSVQFLQAHFAVCAFLDETTQCSDWEGRDPWRANQLQRQFYNTAKAGRIFFERLNNLPPEENAVREVYYYCMVLGFRGMYFQPEDEGELQAVKSRVLADLTGGGGLLTSIQTEGIFPDGYPKVTKRKRFRPLTAASWLVRLVLILAPPAVFILLYLSYAHFLNDMAASLLGQVK